MKKSITLVSLLLIVYASFAQVTPLWTNSQTGIGDNSDRYNAIVRDPATGNLYLGGYTFNDGQDKDYLIVKMNNSGDTLWTRKYNGADNGSDKILYMALDGFGNLYLTGESDGGGINQNDIVTQKYDASGTLLWTSIYNNTAANQDDEALGIAVDNNSNVFITGSTDADSTSADNDDILTLCYTSTGTLSWSAKVNGLGNGTDRGNSVVPDNAGGCVITGRTQTTVDDDVITIKYSSTGTETWRTVYNRGFGNDRGENIAIDGSGNLYVTGRAINANDYDAVTIKYNSSGVAQWTKFYNNVDNDFGKRVFVDGSGNVYITGQTDVNGSGGNTDYDIVTLKYNSAGTQQWVKTFGNAAQNEEDPSAIFVDGSGNVYVTGKSDVNATAAITANNFITLKYNSAGTLLWSVYLNGSATNSDDIAEGFVYDGSTYLYVAGGAQNTTTQKDGTVVKYNVSNGIASWTKSYNGKGDFSDKVQAMIVDSKKNVFVTGYVFDSEVRKDLFIAKLNSSGNTAWFKTYDFSLQDDEGKAIALDTSGNIYVAGNSIGNGTSDDFVTIKFDSLGNILWSARYDFAGEADVAVGIAVNPSNGTVFVTGYSDQDISSKITNYDIATVKYSSTGAQLNVVRYNGAGNGIDRPVDIAVHTSSLPLSIYAIVTGKTWNGTNYDIVTLKYNNTLVQQWATTYAGSAAKDDEARDLFFEQSTGDVYVAGNTGAGAKKDNVFIVKYNTSGVQQWTNNYNGTGNYNDIGYGILVTSSAAYVTGRTAASSTGDTANLITIKYDKATGAQQWASIYKGTGNGLDRGNALAVDQFGNIYACGESLGSGSGSDMVTIGYDATGKIRWTGRYNGAGNSDDAARVMAVDASGYIYVAGYTAGSSINTADATTLKYCPPPPANAGTDVSICKGSSTTLNATGGATFSWTPITNLSNSTIANPVANPAKSTSYIVSVSNGLGCSGSDTVKVTVNPLPAATITADGPIQFCSGDSVIFTANSCSCTYQWKKGTADIAGATNLSYTAKTPSTYKVVVTSNTGCSKTSPGQKVQIVCKSGEAVNEVLDLIATASPNPSASVFTIEWNNNVSTTVTIDVFDLVGSKVFHAENLQNNQIKFGNDLPDGVYMVHVVRGTEQQMIKIIKAQ